MSALFIIFVAFLLTIFVIFYIASKLHLFRIAFCILGLSLVDYFFGSFITFVMITAIVIHAWYKYSHQSYYY